MEFQRMNDDYREKKYPKGSVFERNTGKNRNNSIILLVLLAILAAALVAGLFFFMDLIQYHQLSGNSDEVTVGYVFVGIFVVLLALCVLGLVFCVKNMKKGVDAIMAASAKASGLTVEDIRTFDQQALQSDSYILKLKNAVSAAMANQADGILTRDYLWLGDFGNHIMRRGDIVGACLYQWSYYVNRKRIWALSVAVVNRQNMAITAEVSPESGAALLGLLHRDQPEIVVAPEVLREGKDYDNWRASVTGGAKVQ